MEANDDEKQKKLKDDVILFLEKRSGTDTPRYAARLKTYVDLKYKRRRAAAAKRNSEAALKGKPHEAAFWKNKREQNSAEATEARENEEQDVQKRRGEKTMKVRSMSRSRSVEPADSCCRRRRRRRRRSCRRRRRRRSCGRRRRRRRRSCGRRRRRRRSCSRRRRRRSCRRRRRARRRRRC